MTNDIGDSFETMTPNDDTDETATETNGTDELTECEFCGEEFDDERALAWHWFHVRESEELTDKQFRAAFDEFCRRAEEHEFRVEVPVSVPSETWAYIVDRERGPEADPAALSPEDFDDRTLADAVGDVMDLRFTYEVDR